MDTIHVQEVLKHWEMENEKITGLYYESSGYKAENAVCVGEDYILKRFASETALQRNLELMQSMAETGVDTSTPVLCANGASYVKNGEWMYCLYRGSCKGEIISADLYGADGAEKARFIGEIIGQLHLALEKAQAEVKEADLLQTVRDWALPAVRTALKLDEDFCMQFLKTFEQLYPQLPRQIIHRDPNPGNILMAQDSWGLIDFDMAERNVRLFDPCYAATAVLSENYAAESEEKLQQWLGICRNILQGYDDAAKLTEEEKQAVPYVILANQFVCTAWFAQQKQYPELYEINRGMTRWLIKHMDELKMV